MQHLLPATPASSQVTLYTVPELYSILFPGYIDQAPNLLWVEANMVFKLIEGTCSSASPTEHPNP